MEKLVGILLMAGLSSRFGGPKNKQVCLLNNKPVFSYSISTFANHKDISELIIVVNSINRNEVEDFVIENNINATIILGGETRQQSVENALAICKLDDDDIVMIHDGARPLIDNKIITNVYKAAIESGAATAYLEGTDTFAIKNDSDEIEEFVNRSFVAQIQTPQAFKFALLKEAHDRANDLNATDDCSLVMKLGKKVKLIKGDKKFHKITTQEDIKYLEGLLKQ